MQLSSVVVCLQPQNGFYEYLSHTFGDRQLFFPCLVKPIGRMKRYTAGFGSPLKCVKHKLKIQESKFWIFFFPSAHIKNELVICGLYPLGFSLNKMLENINSFGEELSPAKAVLFFSHDFKALWTRINMRLGTLLLACS